MLHINRRGYFFGYGADQEEDMIKAITNQRPQIIGSAILKDYELRIQKLGEISNPKVRNLLQKSWGKSFKSYVIVPKPGAVVKGVLFKLSVRDRHLIDKWELVEMGWYSKVFVTVTLNNGKKVLAETQVLSPGQHAAKPARGANRPWLMPKRLFLRIAQRASKPSHNDQLLK